MSDFGRELRRARMDRDLGLRACARRLLLSHGQLSKVENGHQPPNKSLPRLADQFFDTGDKFRRLAAREAAKESDSPSLPDFDDLAPGGVQFEAVRPQLVVPSPATVQIFGRMFDQFASLDAVAGPHAAIEGVRVQLRTIEAALHRAHEPIRQELMHTAAKYAELAGWLAQDSGAYEAAAKWSAKAADFAAECNDTALLAYIWTRRSNIATDSGYFSEGLLLAQGALGDATVPRDIRALAFRQEAAAHALAGEPTAVARALDNALDEATRDGPTSPYAPYLSTSYLQSEGAAAWARLGQPERSVELLTDALKDWPAEQARDRGIGLSRLARAQLLSGDFDQARRTATEAATAVSQAVSSRAIDELNKLRSALGKLHEDSHAQDLLTLLDSVTHS